MRKINLLAASVLTSAGFPVVASAQTVLFSQNFDTPGAGTLFTQHLGTSDGTNDFQIDFNYDYGAFDYLRFPDGPLNPPTIQPIPPVPGGATTRGLRISVNDVEPGNKQTVQLIPNGVNPGTDFRIEFHMWMNYNGGALGGTGSTQAMVAGLNTQAGGTGLIGPSGAAPSITPLPGDGYAITANGEGGSANDYRMYDRGDPIDDGPNFPKVNGTWPGSSELRFDRTTGDLVLAAGNPVLDTPSNHANSYYDTVFPGDAIGGGQFETRGAPGKAWVPVVIEQRGNEVTFSMNGQHISTLFRQDAAVGVPEFGYTDEFASVASPAIDNFILFENIIVTQFAAASRFTASSGNYSNAGNWSAGVPNGANEKADFGGAPGAATVNVDVPVALRSIVFSGPDTYTVSGANTITMSANHNTLMTNAGSHVITAPINSQGHLSIFAADGTTLRVSNLTHDATKAFTKAGTGVAEVNAVRGRQLTVTGGTLRLLPGGVSRVTSVDLLNATSKLDMTNAPMIVDYTYRQAPGDPTKNNRPNNGLIIEILSGFNGGDWLGTTGITSANAIADPNAYAIGYLANEDVGLGTFLGETIDSDTFIVRGTRKGDANLDGTVSLADFNALAANFGSTDAEWYEGDFQNYDRIVDLSDFNALAGNFGFSASAGGPTPQDWAMLGSMVPEPGSVALLSLAALPLMRRRRRA